MSRRAALWPLVMAALLAAISASQAATVFLGATVIDGTGAPPLDDGAVVVDAGRIVAIRPRADAPGPAGADIVDLTGRWIIPGLIDAHIHFFQSGGLYTRPDIIDLRRLRPYAAERAMASATIEATFARYLASGITGVVDVGGPMENFAIRARGIRTALSPRIAVAGPLLATYAPRELAGDDPPIVRIKRADEARASVRAQLEHGPDLIKIWFVRPGTDISAEMAWVRAVIAESYAAGVRVAVHATQARIARAVVEAGAEILVHSIDDRVIDDALLDLMAANDVIYVTTLVVGEGYREVFGSGVDLSEIEQRLGDPAVIASFAELARLPRRLLPSWVRPRPRLRLSAVIAENLRRVQARGIAIAAGSDAGNIGTLHGPALHREIELMVEAGLTPMQVLVAATRGAAAVMGRRDVGTLLPGKRADFVILDGDPLADIRNTRRIEGIVKDGFLRAPAAIMAAAVE